MTWSNHRFRSRNISDLGLRPADPTPVGLLTEGILDANIDTGTPGSTRVALWREWQGMLADLHSVGPVWSIVRNGHCVLAVQGDYPQLSFSPDQQAALARDGDHALTCHFRAWRQATAFESGCCCGRLYGVEIANGDGQIFHRVCLTPGSDHGAFVEWTQMHQATGLEDEPDEATPLDQGRFHPQSYARHPGTLEAPLPRLRTVLIQAAQREISLAAGVTSEGSTQSARIDITRASEAQGWLVLSGQGRSLYVEAEPEGSLLAEPVSVEGESSWRLSLIDADDRRLLHLQSGSEDRSAWNQLVRECVFCSSASKE